MAHEIWLIRNVEAIIVGQLISVISTHVAEGENNVQFVRGAVAMARGTAVAHMCNWKTIVNSARESLDPASITALDSAVKPLLTGRV